MNTSTPQFLARSRRHMVTLGRSASMSVVVIGSAIAAIAAEIPLFRTSLGLTILMAALCIGLGYTLLYPLYAFSSFAIEVYTDYILVYEVQGLGIEVRRYPLESTTVRIRRRLWDYILGTGSLTLHGPGGAQQFTLLTPIDWAKRIGSTS